MGCPCHIVHNIAGKGSSAFEAVSLHILCNIKCGYNFFWFQDLMLKI